MEACASVEAEASWVRNPVGQTRCCHQPPRSGVRGLPALCHFDILYIEISLNVAKKQRCFGVSALS